MLDEFIAVVAEEVAGPVVTGYFRAAKSPQIRRWKRAAWIWMGASLASFALTAGIDHPFGVGLALAGGLASVAVSLVASASATALHRRLIQSQSPHPRVSP